MSSRSIIEVQFLAVGFHDRRWRSLAIDALRTNIAG
jgi:hypothetical protein